MKNFSILLIKLLTTAGILLLISTTTSYIEGRPTTRHFYDKRKALRSSEKPIIKSIKEIDPNTLKITWETLYSTKNLTRFRIFYTDINDERDLYEWPAQVRKENESNVISGGEHYFSDYFNSTFDCYTHCSKNPTCSYAIYSSKVAENYPNCFMKKKWRPYNQQHHQHHQQILTSAEHENGAEFVEVSGYKNEAILHGIPTNLNYSFSLIVYDEALDLWSLESETYYFIGRPLRFQLKYRLEGDDIVFFWDRLPESHNLTISRINMKIWSNGAAYTNGYINGYNNGYNGKSNSSSKSSPETVPVLDDIIKYKLEPEYFKLNKEFTNVNGEDECFIKCLNQSNCVRYVYLRNSSRCHLLSKLDPARSQLKNVDASSYSIKSSSNEHKLNLNHLKPNTTSRIKLETISEFGSSQFSNGIRIKKDEDGKVVEIVVEEFDPGEPSGSRRDQNGDNESGWGINTKIFGSDDHDHEHHGSQEDHDQDQDEDHDRDRDGYSDRDRDRDRDRDQDRYPDRDRDGHVGKDRDHDKDRYPHDHDRYPGDGDQGRDRDRDQERYPGDRDKDKRPDSERDRDQGRDKDIDQLDRDRDRYPGQDQDRNRYPSDHGLDRDRDQGRDRDRDQLDRDRDRYPGQDRDRDQDRYPGDRDKDKHPDRERDRDQGRDKDRDQSDRDRDQNRDRYPGQDRDRDRDQYPSDHGQDIGRDRDQGRDRDRDGDRDKDKDRYPGFDPNRPDQDRDRDRERYPDGGDRDSHKYPGGDRDQERDHGHDKDRDPYDPNRDRYPDQGQEDKDIDRDRDHSDNRDRDQYDNDRDRYPEDRDRDPSLDKDTDRDQGRDQFPDRDRDGNQYDPYGNRYPYPGQDKDRDNKDKDKHPYDPSRDREHDRDSYNPERDREREREKDPNSISSGDRIDNSYDNRDKDKVSQSTTREPLTLPPPIEWPYTAPYTDKKDDGDEEFDNIDPDMNNSRNKLQLDKSPEQSERVDRYFEIECAWPSSKDSNVFPVWKKTGASTSENNRLYVYRVFDARTNTAKSKLIIKRLSKSDQGTYECSFPNNPNQTPITFRLAVTDVPSQPLLLNASILDDGNTFIEWLVANNGGAEITRGFLEWSPTEFETRFKSRRQVRDSQLSRRISLTKEELKNSKLKRPLNIPQYSLVRVIVENTNGASEPSKPRRLICLKPNCTLNTIAPPEKVKLESDDKSCCFVKYFIIGSAVLIALIIIAMIIFLVVRSKRRSSGSGTQQNDNTRPLLRTIII